MQPCTNTSFFLLQSSQKTTKIYMNYNSNHLNEKFQRIFSQKSPEDLFSLSIHSRKSFFQLKTPIKQTKNILTSRKPSRIYICTFSSDKRSLQLRFWTFRNNWKREKSMKIKKKRNEGKKNSNLLKKSFFLYRIFYKIGHIFHSI